MSQSVVYVSAVVLKAKLRFEFEVKWFLFQLVYREKFHYTLQFHLYNFHKSVEDKNVCHAAQENPSSV